MAIQFGACGLLFVMPGLSGTYDTVALLRQCEYLARRNSGVGWAAGTYTHGATAVNNAYIGGVYSPAQNRIYLVPFGQANQVTWHYIDCVTGAIVAYTQSQNRIYFSPYLQANQTNWHYIDCATGIVTAYAHGVTAVSGAYSGSTYDPNRNRTYFIPLGQSDETTWHYIRDTGAGMPKQVMAHGIFNKL